jgi:hypothetical protein
MKKRYPSILGLTASCPEISQPHLILNGRKLRHQLLGLILLLASTYVYAQGAFDGPASGDSYIVNAVVYNKGVYRTFDEFKNNKPSITDYYIIEQGKIWKTYDSGPKKKIKKSKIWGYCSGDKIFVRTVKYNQIRELGRYCYFRDHGKSEIYGTSTKTPVLFTPYKERMIIDFNTGKINRLTTKLMKQILETDDHELLAEYMAESSKEQKLYEYLMKYNQRNKAKIR